MISTHDEAARSLAHRMKRGVIIHAHIAPAFARPRSPQSPSSSSAASSPKQKNPWNDNDDQDGDLELNEFEASHNKETGSIKTTIPTSPLQSTTIQETHPLNTKWVKDLCSCILITSQQPHPRPFPIRVTLVSLSDLPVFFTTSTNRTQPPPQKYLITMKAPTEDVFFHWTFSCNPFSFRSLVRRHGWTAISGSPIKPTAHAITTQTDFSNWDTAYDGFGRLFKDLVRNCLNDPKRYQVRVELTAPESSASLIFSELINGYRRVTLLDLEFSPSPWSQVVLDIRNDHQRTLTHYKQLKSGLVQSLDTVCKKHPYILLSGGVPDPLQPTMTQAWRDIVRDLLPTREEELEDVIGNNSSSGLLTDEERMLRKKIFVLLTMPQDENVEVAFVKSLPVRVFGYGDSSSGETFGGKGKENEDQDMRLTFTIFAKGADSKQPTSYIITLTNTNDIFFNFTSPEITPSVFRHITRNLNVNPSNTLHLDTPFTPQLPSTLHKSWTSPAAGQSSKQHHTNDRDKIIGFHLHDGAPAGGVIGVLGHDLLTACDAHPERVRAELRISLENGGGGGGGAKVTSVDPPRLRKAVVRVLESVMFRERLLVEWDVFETTREQMKLEVQEKYTKLKREIDWTQLRLDTLYDAVRHKNPSLLVELGKIPVPRSFTSSKSRWNQQKPSSQQLEAAAATENTGRDTATSPGISVPIMEPATPDRPGSPTKLLPNNVSTTASNTAHNRIRGPALFSTRSLVPAKERTQWLAGRAEAHFSKAQNESAKETSSRKQHPGNRRIIRDFPWAVPSVHLWRETEEETRRYLEDTGRTWVAQDPFMHSRPPQQTPVSRIPIQVSVPPKKKLALKSRTPSPRRRVGVLLKTPMSSPGRPPIGLGGRLSPTRSASPTRADNPKKAQSLKTKPFVTSPTRPASRLATSMSASKTYTKGHLSQETNSPSKGYASSGVERDSSQTPRGGHVFRPWPQLPAASFQAPLFENLRMNKG